MINLLTYFLAYLLTNTQFRRRQSGGVDAFGVDDITD